MKARIQIQGIAVIFAVILVIILYRNIFPKWHNEGVDEYLDIAGVVMVLFGFLLRLSARGYKEKESFKGKKLVKDGPYALIRNPMYFGILMIGTGFVIALFEWWAFPVFLSVFLLIYIPQIKKEEGDLLKQFGEEYKSYCAKTPKYFPRVDYLLSPKKYIPLKLSWIRKELSALIATVVIILAIEILKDIDLFGHKELFKEPLELLLIAILFILIIFLLLKQKIEK